MTGVGRCAQGRKNARLAARFAFLGVAILCALLDQYSKALILAEQARNALPRSFGDYLDFVLVFNKGVTFGILSAGHGNLMSDLFIALASIAVICLIVTIFRSRNLVPAFCAALIAGGALGNIVDRVRFGAVVDFIYCHVKDWSWYVFNVGDSFIVIGVVLWMASSLFNSSQERS